MSADNYIFVDKKTFEVWDCVASCVTDLKKKNDIQKQKSSLIGKGKNLEEALKIADEANDYLVEYGIHFKLWCK
jgi:hypothetical protein